MITKKFKYSQLIFGMFILLTVILFLGGCGKTYQVAKVRTSGFLGDYSQLHKGAKGEAQLLYINPAAKFGAYDKILMDPVKIYADKNGKLSKLPKKDVQNILSYLDAAVREQLKNQYDFVDRSGRGVMRLRLAITEAEGSMVVLDTVSSILPIGMAISGISRVAFGTYGPVGKAGIEAELLDSQTGERLAAAVGRRAGEKYTGKFDKFNKWRAIQGACDYWAVRLSHRLAELKANDGR